MYVDYWICQMIIVEIQWFVYLVYVQFSKMECLFLLHFVLFHFERRMTFPYIS
jgi:hypothetical protein